MTTSAARYGRFCTPIWPGSLVVAPPPRPQPSPLGCCCIRLFFACLFWCLGKQCCRIRLCGMYVFLSVGGGLTLTRLIHTCAAYRQPPLLYLETLVPRGVVWHACLVRWAGGEADYGFLARLFGWDGERGGWVWPSDVHVLLEVVHSVTAASWEPGLAVLCTTTTDTTPSIGTKPLPHSYCLATCLLH